jgi:phage-related holin
MKEFLLKAISSIPIAAFMFTENQKTVIFGIILVVSLDFVLGSIVALKYKIFHSAAMKRTINKIALYGLAMLNVWILASVDNNFCFAFKYTGVFIIVTEVISNFEKLALMGFKIPSILIGQINKKFMNLWEDTTKAEEIATKRSKL